MLTACENMRQQILLNLTNRKHMKVRFNGGIKDVPLTEVTAANYIVPKGEEMVYHVLQEKVEYDRNNGKRKSRPVVQKYDTKVYPTTSKYLRDAGYTLTVLHDPTLWQQQQAAAAAKVEQQRRQAQQQQAARQAQAEREALKAELRRELLEELKAEKQNVKGGRKK